MKIDVDMEFNHGTDDHFLSVEEADADEENQDDFDDSDSINDMNTSVAWPQSYRQSMDMYTMLSPPPIGFLRGNSIANHSNLLSQPLIDNGDGQPMQDKEAFPSVSASASASASQLSQTSSYSKRSTMELPPPIKQCSFAQSVLNGINVLCGIGLLTTPYAVKEGGWLSLTFLLIFCVMGLYTGILLKRCLESTPGLQTYPDIGQAAFGLSGRLLIAIALYSELYGTCVEFITMIADNLDSLFSNTGLSFGGINLDSQQIFAITAALAVLPTVWLRNLNLLSYFSAGGVVASILVSLCLVWVGVVDKVGFHGSGTAINFGTLTATIGIYGYSYSGHSVFPNIYTSMKQPARFPFVIASSFVFCIILYVGVAVCGFLMFGEATQSQFTLNMPKHLVASKIAAWTVVVSPITKYALTMTPVTMSIEELLPLAWRGSYWLSAFIRTLLVLSTLLVSLTVPFFASLLSLLGSMLAMLISFILPCACYLSLFRGRLNKLQIGGCILIMIVGFVCACFGTYSAISNLVNSTA